VAALKAKKTDQTLELASLQPAVQKVFHLTRMDTVFSIHDDATSAIEGVADAS
jgi:anti-sigma B factor antagonist